MTGGLLQIVTSGKQDIYLTINPEITFFKKVFRRYTNFSLELIEFLPEYLPNYNDNVVFKINKGDVIHRCYLEVELDKLQFNDDLIENLDYISRKKLIKDNLKKTIREWEEKYNNLKNYVDLIMKLYRNLETLLNLDNININFLKDEVSKFNYLNIEKKILYIKKVEEVIFKKIDISLYINNITKLVTNKEENYDKNIYISKFEIKYELKKMYMTMIEYLSFYNNNALKYKEELNSIDFIDFNFANYLGHNYFKYFFLEIGGIKVAEYSSDVLHINQMHYIKNDNFNNYLEMIGHIPSLYEFNINEKGNIKINIPLIFWFNKDTGLSLPLVALQYSNIVIGAEISDINDIISFVDFEKMFDKITVLTVDIDQNFSYKFNKELITTSKKVNINSKSITYYCSYINDEFLKIKYPELSSNDRQIILEKNGTLFTKNQITKIMNPNLDDLKIENMNLSTGNQQSYLINKIQWVGLMNDIKNPIYKKIAPIIGSYYPYIDFNRYLSKITSINNNPKIKLIAEVVFLDDIEREKFADSKLEYVIETIEEDKISIIEKNQFEYELSFGKPIKELIWYIQPSIYPKKFSIYGQNFSKLYNYENYFKNDPILRQKLIFNQLDLLLNKVDLNYYIYVMSYKYLNNMLPKGLYYYSFSLYPEESQPSGTFNLRQIKGKQYKLELNSIFMDELENLNKIIYKADYKKELKLHFIAKSYNFFTIENGNGKLLFY